MHLPQAVIQQKINLFDFREVFFTVK